MIAAVILEIAVLDSTSSPTLLYTHELLLHTVPAFVAGAVLFMAVALGAHQGTTDEMPPRWLLRAAPLLLSAVAPTALGGWLVFVEGYSKLNGLIVLPALILWGGVAGEWTAHRWLANGHPASTLIRRSFVGAGSVVGVLVLSAWVLRSPAGELEVARSKCREQYARSRTAEDSAFAHQWKPTVARELGTRSCSELLPAEPGAAADAGPE